jgi:phosphatidate cytidylyltransferase
VVAATMTLGIERLPAGATKRVLTAVVVIPLFVWLVTRGPAWLFAAFVLAAGAAALWELMRMFEGAGQPTYARLGVVLGVLVMASFGLSASLMPPAVALSLAAAILLSAPVWSHRSPATEAVALTLLGVLYIGWFLGHTLALYRVPDGPDLILLLAGVTWAGESAAYVVGSTVGQHKLAPTISPRKTVEGAVAQLIASVVAAPALAAWLRPEWSMTQALVAGAILGVAGQVGDLAESAMKRAVGVKDAGGLIPGHGGVLDRIDGLLFNVPAFYYYVTLGTAR